MARANATRTGDPGHRSDLDLEPELDVELEVERLVAGGEGLARRPDEPVVFVAGTAPGERVRARVVETHRSYGRAELVEVLRPSPDRVQPPCPWVAAGCGGCDLQHLAPETQPAHKAQMVVDALVRMGHVAHPAVIVGEPLPSRGFRTTVRAAVAGGRAGFRRARSHEVVVPEACLVAHPWVAQVLADGRFGPAVEVVVRVGAATGERLVVVTPSADEVVLPPDPPGVGTHLVGADQLASGRRAWIHEEVGGRRLRVSARSFFQSRPDGAAALVAAVRRAVGAELAGARVVDAYSGMGLLAAGLLDRPAASGGPDSVLCVERSAAAVADARVNLAAEVEARRAKVVRADVDRWHPGRAEIVVADPSRSGLGRRAVRVLARTGASVVTLVSCDAAALGRDAGLLAEAGFRFEQAELVDLFPHTHHVEVVSCFRR